MKFFRLSGLNLKYDSLYRCVSVSQMKIINKLLIEDTATQKYNTRKSGQSTLPGYSSSHQCLTIDKEDRKVLTCRPPEGKQLKCANGTNPWDPFVRKLNDTTSTFLTGERLLLNVPDLRVVEKSGD